MPNKKTLKRDIFMTTDRSDEIRVQVLRQRIDKFMKYLETEKSAADDASLRSEGGFGNNSIDAVSGTLDSISKKAKDIFEGKEDEPVKLD